MQKLKKEEERNKTPILFVKKIKIQIATAILAQFRELKLQK